ncbi:hypothetical protein F441_09953 [Phytophthora nicotianae CJ01A1]|uniref:Uncharacterized protein n=5 Tax=Phytophthora nicotianae TaxID=4792 RepID=W2R7A5_PHYN3|nr:hypothetical protein PPTG_01504 [Phytophthora nicotianae INRA-310]ETI45412.1 hypothetical protein F443_10007 [Phytophthora nicotianae P1569]ETL91906.1 hypothetical protein L917_09631 [Phytophthora nicotianae]ETO74047.1 hypothetical protein F444_10099 [Phytophthora nicotianae P1976]ETP15213.1 hypothetical protein F441_09953 [Phytophthora nicotianae CJ01A1]ETM45200.1 hypothetical protein L914_09678 [Phytophthora nicotianae]
MIYLATNNLVKQEQKNEERLQNQSKEGADRRAAEQEAIARSRRHQLDCKQREKEHEAQEELECVVQWEQFGRRIEMQYNRNVDWRTFDL